MKVTFTQRAIRDLVPAEWAAVRARAAKLPERGKVPVFEASDRPGWFVARVHGEPLPHRYPTAYDAACAALGRLEVEQ